jgi:hypothetical protein
MIDEISMNRIIGDFLEVNASMIEKREKSKLPKFISNYIWKRDRNKLLKNIDTLKNSNYVLSLENISELSLYIFNNFDDKKYKSIIKVKIDKLITYENMEMLLKFDNITAIFEFSANETTFDVKIMELSENDTRNNFNFTLHKLSSNKSFSILDRINTELKNVLCDYVYEIISSYK